MALNTQLSRISRRTGRNLATCTATLVVLCIAATSCGSTDDELPAPGLCSSRIMVDWSGYEKDAPSGMTILFHHSASGEMAQSIDNTTTSATAVLAPGRHWATVFNLTPDEFDNIGFRGLESVATAEAYAREYTGHIWHNIPCNENSYVACQPEWLATDTILTDVVGTLPQHEAIGTLHPRNIIYTLNIGVTVSNPAAIISARGAISGLAAGRRLSASSPDKDSPTVVHIIDPADWTITKEGVVKARVRCFGLPAGHRGLPEENIFEFQALLSDGKTVKSYLIDAGDLMKAVSDSGKPNNDIRLDVQVDLPQTQGGDCGDMDIWLDIWDESIDYDIQL